MMVSCTVNRTVSHVVFGGHSVKRQTWTKVGDVVSERARVVRLWDDVKDVASTVFATEPIVNHSNG